jgi:hypothetical protein
MDETEQTAADTAFLNGQPLKQEAPEPSPPPPPPTLADVFREATLARRELEEINMRVENLQIQAAVLVGVLVLLGILAVKLARKGTRP